MGIFSDNAPLYIEREIIVIPLNGKIPKLKNWPNASLANMADMADILTDDYNIGVVCGATNNIVAIDLDSFAEHHEKLLSLLPPSPCRKVGKKGVTCFFRFNGEASKKFLVRGQTFCEILSTGNQTVLPPSLHPETLQHYKWITPDSLLDIDISELPTLPSNYIELIESVVSEIETGATESKNTPIASTGRHNTLFSQIRAAIEKNKSPNDIAFEIYNYDLENHNPPWLSDETEKPFQGCPRKHPRRMAMKWVLYEYQRVVEKSKNEIELVSPVDTMTVRIEDLQLSQLHTNTTPRIQLASKLEELALNAPGTCGDIVRWIVETARVPQPALALGAAIAVLGTLKAHKFSTDDDLRTNHFITTLAESGSGKDHPLKCASTLLRESGMHRSLGGDPVSEAALLRIVSETKGRTFIGLDEIGLKLRGLNNQNSSSHETGIIRALTSMWSCANSVYVGKEYANHDGRMSRKDIVQPCVNIYGTTEPTSFYQALKTKEMSGGFLPRWLIFQISNPDAKKQKQNKRNIPSKLLEQLNQLASIEIDYEKELNMHVGADCEALTPSPKTTHFDREASSMLDDIDDAFNARKREARKLEKGIDALWARGLEHTCKLALTVANVDRAIDRKNLSWCVDVVRCSLELSTQMFLEHSSESPHEERANKILNIINKNPGITKREIIQRTRSMSVKERDSVLESLIMSESVHCSISATNNNPKKFTSYFISTEAPDILKV